MAWAIRLGFRWVTAAAAVGLLAVVAAGQGSAPRPATAPYTTWRDYGGSADSMQYSALAEIDKTNVEPARAGLVLSGGRRRRAPAFQPDRGRRCDVRRRRERRRRRARRADGQSRCGRRPSRPPSAASPTGRMPDRSDRRLLLNTGGGLRAIDAHQRRAHHDVRQGRVRRHADWRAAAAAPGRTRRPAASSRT